MHFLIEQSNQSDSGRIISPPNVENCAKICQGTAEILCNVQGLDPQGQGHRFEAKIFKRTTREEIKIRSRPTADSLTGYAMN